MKRLILIFLGMSLVFSGCYSDNDNRGITQPLDKTVIEGQTATFSVSTAGVVVVGYQWMRNGSRIPGANAASYETPQLNPADNGAQFSVRVRTRFKTIVSSPATLSVYSITDIPAPVETIVDPLDTDPDISISSGNHYVYLNPAVTSKNKLFVFFPGANANPRAYTLLIQAAANNGFHAVGLVYVDAGTVYTKCRNADIQCPGRLHEEVLTGQATESPIEVPVADSIINRLTKLLIYLDRQNPDDGWDQFLTDDDSLLWNVIRVAGHSQGGSTAAYIGKRFKVDRVTCFSSPYDLVNSQTASWISDQGETDPSRYFGFSHMADKLITWSVIQMNWPTLGMDQFGDYEDVDESSPDYGGSHMLYSTLTVTDANLITYHNITVFDNNTPVDSDGLPIYMPVWQYIGFLN